MTASVPRCRYRQEPGRQLSRFEAVDHAFGIRLCGQLEAMDEPRRPEPRGIKGGIRNVVAVREKNVAYAAPRGEAPRQVLDKSRRIDEPVAAGMLHKIAVAAERFARIEAAV